MKPLAGASLVALAHVMGGPPVAAAGDAPRRVGPPGAPAREATPRLAPETPLPRRAVRRLWAGVALGQGLRFNNPYRLPTVLGRDAESLSLTAPYLDLRLAAVRGSDGGVAQGLSVHASKALRGVAQEVVTPGWQLSLDLARRWAARGRVGVPVVVRPDLGVGAELGLGGVYRVSAAGGVTVDLVGSWFQGAATPTTPRTDIPILSLELGVLYDHEVLP